VAVLAVRVTLWLVWAAMLLARLYFSGQARRGDRPARFGQFFSSPKWLAASWWWSSGGVSARSPDLQLWVLSIRRRPFDVEV
jgi:hypothetical protein